MKAARKNPVAKDPPATEIIPEHLLPYIAKQNPSLYTAIDHASWRYILRVSKKFFKNYAHQKYLDGLRETGISTERIPLIEEMDQCLRRFGWRAVAVVGFIPPAVFLEFQSLGILVIGCDIRTLEHLAYTPAPDIVHEAAGHAPIVADPDYRAYLRSYGEVARNAIFSRHDIEIYERIRDLSDIKEDPRSTPEQIEAAQKAFEKAAEAADHVSEAAQLSRMAWWTTEYGLIGDSKNALIYGAGLLSSISESYHCLSEKVRKIPLTVDCVNLGYDITQPQPQLYVTPDFTALGKVLEEFASTMAFRRGGIEGLKKAQRAATATTTVLDSGLQISATFSDFIRDESGQLIYLQYSGPAQLARNDVELPGHGAKYHSQGFSTPIGMVQLAGGSLKKPQDLTHSDLEAMGFKEKNAGRLQFASGVEIAGAVSDIRSGEGQTWVIRFEGCTIRLGDRVLFQPEWGSFDLACGTKVISVFGGAADRAKYLAVTGGNQQRPASQKTNRTEKNRHLETLYAQVRTIRENEGKKGLHKPADELREIQRELDEKYPDDWLLRLELLELNSTLKLNAPWADAVTRELAELCARSAEIDELIRRGVELL